MLPRAKLGPPLGLSRVGGPGFLASPMRNHSLVVLEQWGSTRPRQGTPLEQKWRKGEKKTFK
eukprot:4549513-Amphidinium_carterae.1